MFELFESLGFWGTLIVIAIIFVAIIAGVYFLEGLLSGVDKYDRFVGDKKRSN